MSAIAVFSLTAEEFREQANGSLEQARALVCAKYDAWRQSEFARRKGSGPWLNITTVNVYAVVPRIEVLYE